MSVSKERRCYNYFGYVFFKKLVLNAFVEIKKVGAQNYNVHSIIFLDNGVNMSSKRLKPLSWNNLVFQKPLK